MSEIVKAPWTPEQVESLNGFQHCGFWHEFTCGGHITPTPENPHGDCRNVLKATEQGWVCDICGYTQDWCHDFMANGSWKKHGWILEQLKQKPESIVPEWEMRFQVIVHYKLKDTHQWGSDWLDKEGRPAVQPDFMTLQEAGIAISKMPGHFGARSAGFVDVMVPIEITDIFLRVEDEGDRAIAKRRAAHDAEGQEDQSGGAETEGTEGN